MSETAKDILTRALEKILREYDLKITTVHVIWEGPIHGNIPGYKYAVRGLEVNAFLKDPE